MKKNKINKAFTLLELVIVISIISILSATAVVTYVGVTKSAKTSNDELLVSQLNKVLKLEESDGVVPNTPSEIFDFLNEYGIGVKIDDEKNKIRGEEVEISSEDSRVKVYVVPTNEELMIARETMNIVNKN